MPPRALTRPLLVASLTLWIASAAAQPRTLPSETPTRYTAATPGFEYTRREAMIAMRDGVKLYTVILVPKGAKNAPILLTRTPYNAAEMTGHGQSPHLGPILQ